MNIELTRNRISSPRSARTKSRDSCCAALRWRRRTFSITPRAKLRRKNCDMLVANSLRDKGAGFGTDTNVATLLFKDGHRETPPMMSKEALADLILDRLLAMSN